jgi:hypothetical protein
VVEDELVSAFDADVIVTEEPSKYVVVEVDVIDPSGYWQVCQDIVLKSSLTWVPESVVCARRPSAHTKDRSSGARKRMAAGIGRRHDG